MTFLSNVAPAAAAAAAATGGFGTATGGLFNQTQPQQPGSSLFKPFGHTTTTPSAGFSFGNTPMGQANASNMVCITTFVLPRS